MVGPPNPFVFQRFQLHWLCSNWLLYILIMLYGDEKTLSGRWTYEVCLMWLWCLPWWIRCTHAHQQEKGTWHWISMFKLTWWSFIHSIMCMVLWNLPSPGTTPAFIGWCWSEPGPSRQEEIQWSQAMPEDHIGWCIFQPLLPQRGLSTGHDFVYIYTHTNQHIYIYIYM